MNQDHNRPDRLIDAKERRLLVPYSDMHIWRLEREGKFPKRIKIGANRVAWRLSEVLAWIDEKADARD
jgi:prophage regulatory protein